MKYFRILCCIILLGYLAPVPLHAQPTISLVMETEQVPLVEYGPLTSKHQITAEELKEWYNTLPFLQSIITTKLVRSISHDNGAEMENYEYQHGRQISLEFLGENQNYVIYKATLDELPSQTKTVKRYLTSYIVALRIEGHFLPNRFIFTIEDEQSE